MFVRILGFYGWGQIYPNLIQYNLSKITLLKKYIYQQTININKHLFVYKLVNIIKNIFFKN